MRARIGRGQAGPLNQKLIGTAERAWLNRFRKENRELRREQDFFRLAATPIALTRRASTGGRSSSRRKISADRPTVFGDD